MFTYGSGAEEEEGEGEEEGEQIQTNKTEHRPRRRVQVAAAVIDDEVRVKVLKRASGQMHQTPAETQINSIFLFVFPSLSLPFSVMNKHDKTSASII